MVLIYLFLLANTSKCDEHTVVWSIKMKEAWSKDVTSNALHIHYVSGVGVVASPCDMLGLLETLISPRTALPHTAGVFGCHSSLQCEWFTWTSMHLGSGASHMMPKKARRLCFHPIWFVSLCVSVSRITQKTSRRILMKLGRQLDLGERDNRLDFRIELEIQQPNTP